MSLFTFLHFSTGSPRSHFLPSPLAHVSELDISGEDNDDDNSYYGLAEEDTKMQDEGASSAAKKASIVKKPPTSKPDPTAAIAAIASGLKAASLLLLQPKFVRYNLSIKFLVTVSPTGYFKDGQMRICVDFQGIGMDLNNYRAETSGKTLKLFMRIPHKFIGPNRVDGEWELAAVLNDRDTIVSAQRETANMIYPQYGNDGLPIIQFVVVENH